MIPTELEKNIFCMYFTKFSFFFISGKHHAYLVFQIANIKISSFPFLNLAQELMP